MGFFNRKKDDGKDGKDAKKSNAPKAEKPKAEEPKKDEVKKEEAKKEEVKAAPAPRETGHAYRILIRPIVTEKSTRLGRVNQYAFEVAMTANKPEIRKAVKAVYGVTPTDVRVMRVLGKPVRTRAGKSRRSDWRKALVTLKKGDRIDQFANA
jgi:large subunit ribosomal protein L23